MKENEYTLNDIKDPLARLLVSQTIETNKQLLLTIEKLQAELAEMKRLLFGRSSERVEPIERQMRQESGKSKGEKQKETNEKRKKRREQKKALPQVDVVHKIPEEELKCPRCGSSEFFDLGVGQESDEYEYHPPKLVKVHHTREKKVCSCGEHIVIAPAPARVTEGTHYGPGLHANVVVQKCADAIPFYRQEKALQRAGIPISRTTLKDLFHRGAELLTPLHNRLIELVPNDKYVNADETRLNIQQKGGCETGWMWTFLTHDIVVFSFTTSRSGQLPLEILGDSSGYLQTDGYKGYALVCSLDKRKDVGCFSHVRRYFYKALDTENELAGYALAQIFELYKVEYRAAEKNVLGTDEHLAMRKLQSRDVLENWKEWLDQQQKLHPPKSPIGRAFTYTQNNWQSLLTFLEDPKIPLDNNCSERALRGIAIGRKNFMFVGSEQAGKNLAILQSLVATCELHKVNPQEYLTDVLLRIQTHPNSRIDELLPQNWQS